MTVTRSTRGTGIGAAAAAIGMAAAIVASPIAALAQDQTAEPAFTDTQRAEIEAIVAAAIEERFGPAEAETVAPPPPPSRPGPSADLIDGTDPERVLEVVERYGEAEIGVDSAGDPQITGEIEGVNFLLFFYGCENNRDCRDVLFIAVFADHEATLASVNQWNSQSRFSAAYIDDEGDALLQMPVNLYGGVSDTNWDDTVDWWRVMAGEFREYVYTAQ